jgi:hypothetical protein
LILIVTIFQAVCCTDGRHCCPAHTVCDSRTGKCKKGDLVVPMVKKLEALQQKNHDCGGNVTCPQENTCCMMKKGDLGCCPVPNVSVVYKSSGSNSQPWSSRL